MTHQLIIEPQTEISEEIRIHLNEYDESIAPDVLHCSSSGVEFLAPTALGPYQQIEMMATVTQSDDSTHHLRCKGVVVHAEWDAHFSQYRNYVFFTDTPKTLHFPLQTPTTDSSQARGFYFISQG